MLIAAFIFVLSFAGLIQFVGLQWRAGLVRVASTSIAQAGTEGLLKDREFERSRGLPEALPRPGWFSF